MSLNVNVTVSIAALARQITPEQLAEIFAEYDEEQMVKFFGKLYKVGIEEWGEEDLQWQFIAVRNSAEKEFYGRECLKLFDLISTLIAPGLSPEAINKIQAARDRKLVDALLEQAIRKDCDYQHKSE